MNSRMTITAEQLKVIPVQRDVWIRDVLRCDVRLVVYDDTGIVYAMLKATLTQSTFRRDIRFSAIMPRLRLIEFFCKWFHIITASPPTPMKSRPKTHLKAAGQRHEESIPKTP